MNPPSAFRFALELLFRSLSRLGGLGLLLTAGFTVTADDGTTLADPGHAVMENPFLRAVVANNEAYGPVHRAGYNGLAELSLAGNHPNVFVPYYAGLNLEHIFSGDAASFGWNIFEPRRAPMRLTRISPTRIELFQERTANWPLQSRLIYELSGDGINFTYSATPTADHWRKHGYIGVFFASYIHAPADMSIEFIGRTRPGKGDTNPRWIKHVPPKHGVAANHRPASSGWDPALDDGFNIDLVGGVSDYEYLHPFYFGRSGDTVLIHMFRRPAGGEVRFAQSPSGGGTGNPAWDFIHYQREYQVNREFGLHARLVLKKFVDRADVIRTYQEWSGETVEDPK